MLKALRCNTHDHTFHYITTIDQIKDAKNDPDAIIWLDLLNPTEQDLAKIAEGFKLHPQLQYGYFAALILMAGLSILLILLFKRLKWL